MAMFLHYFVPKSVEWVHFDIAATELRKASVSCAKRWEWIWRCVFEFRNLRLSFAFEKE